MNVGIVIAMETTTKKIYVGEQMMRVLRYLDQHPDCSKWDASIYIGPDRDGSRGWQVVDRCAKRGLIQEIKVERRKRQVMIVGLTSLGRAAISGDKTRFNYR